MTIEETLKSQVSMWSQLGHPALMERFVLRNGEAHEVGPLIGAPATPKECFKNATEVALSNEDATYVEGYFIRPSLPILIHHAWVLIDGKVMDNTIINNEDGQYYGVEFTDDTLIKHLQINEVYGILATPMLNVDLYLEIDPDMSEFIPK